MNTDPTAPISIRFYADTLAEAASILLHDLSAGYFDDDEDFEDLASLAATRWQNAAANATEATVTVSQTLSEWDELYGVLVCDRSAGTTLKGLLDAIHTGLENAAS